MRSSIIQLFALIGVFAFSFSEMIAQNYNINYFRPFDQNGVNMFETPNLDTVPFDGLKVRVGGAFAQQFQALDHENSMVDLDNDGEIDNALYALEPGFNLATANLNINAQLADGVQLQLVTYLSSRHHPEAWVKSGFIQFDKLPFIKGSDDFMENFRIKVGHMEVNYGDAHFRRTDNGLAIQNPFVGNYIMDAFNTEIGGEIYYFSGPITAMVGATGGEINGNVGVANTSDVDDSDARAPSILAKLAFDDQLSEDFRLRVAGSVYTTSSSSTNHIYTGDRGGSRYYLVMSEPGARAGSDFRTGRFSPNFRDEVTAIQFNTLLKYGGLELFGTFETASGRSHTEEDTRNATQLAADLIYRFGDMEDFYVGARYNTITSEMDAEGNEVSIDRIAFGAGWFLTRNILAKVEYVTQEYTDFPVGSQLDEGKFDGIVIEAVVGF